MFTLTPDDLLEYRLANLKISQTDLQTPGDVVGWLGAAQAQDYHGAKWSLGLRAPESTDADIEQAIADRTIVRTWLHRGTLHFVPASDIHWMLKLLAPRVRLRLAGPCRNLGLTEAILARSQEVMAETLRGGRQLLRSELLDALEQNGIATDGLRASHIFYRAAMDRMICHGNRRGNQFTFTLLDEWTPNTGDLAGEDALARLAERYFTSHGPATVKDFAWWSGLTLASARAGLESVKSRLTCAVLDCETYWMPEPLPDAPTLEDNVFLLPGFDEYMLGYQDRDMVIPKERLAEMTPKNGIFRATIVINGRVAGTWNRLATKSGVIAELNPFTTLSQAQQDAVDAAAARFRSFHASA